MSGDRLINPPDESRYMRELREGWEDGIEEIAERLPFDGVDSELTDFVENAAAVTWDFKIVAALKQDPHNHLSERLIEALVQLMGTGQSVFTVKAFHWPMPTSGAPKRKYRVTLNVEEVTA